MTREEERSDAAEFNSERERNIMKSAENLKGFMFYGQRDKI